MDPLYQLARAVARLEAIADEVPDEGDASAELIQELIDARDSVCNEAAQAVRAKGLLPPVESVEEEADDDD